MARKSKASLTDKVSAAGGLMSLFRFHHVNKCENDDDDFYCTFMRMFQLLVAFIMLCVILYLIYIFLLMPMIVRKRK